ncbi:MAG: CsiV family protein [Pseudomonadota bacterium]|nr:CsiV family protein [Pseudomonadota bacterium]
MAERGKLIVSLLLLCAASAAGAQELSFDGRRWYDVEVSIFTNDVPGGARSEFPVAHKLSAAYLPRLRELTSRTDALMIAFPEDLVPTLAPAVPVTPETGFEVEAEEPLATMGPIYSPPVREAFKLTDFERDAFIDLGTRAAQFTAMNRNIDGAADHRLLWHKVWRQPLEARAQTPAVFVTGGDQRGDHYELEGSLRVVANGAGAMLDINVWLNEFRAGAPAPGFMVPSPETQDEWKIPELPFSDETNAVAPQTAAFPSASTTLPGAAIAPAPAVPTAQAWELTAVWQLAQTREMSANQLYYLDHPAFGVLIQVRPYVLPPRLPVDGAEDF